MALFTKQAAQIFAGHNTDSAARDVLNGEVQTWGTELETAISAVTTAGGVLFSSKATMDATLTYAANTPALVIGDATTANNGLYRKSGASGSGSWIRVADVPGYSFVRATNAGAGTANAIVATTAIPVNESQLIALPIAVANTASPVTVAFNGGSALTIKTNAGNNPAIGGLTAGMIAAGYVDGSTFRLLSDQASAAVLAEIEALHADFTERYVGAQVDDAAATAAAGGTPSDGTLYFNTTAGLFRVYYTGAWQDQAIALGDGDVTFVKLATALVQDSTTTDDPDDITIPTTQRVVDQINVRTYLTLERFGGVAGSDDNRAALLAAFAEMEASGKVLDLGANTYGFLGEDGAIDQTFTHKPKIYADGGVLKLSNLGVGADHIDYFLRLRCGVYGFDFRGWYADGNDDTCCPIYIQNSSNMATIADAYASDWGAKRAYRPNDTFNFGNGIYIEGGLRHVVLDRPTVESVLLNTGAGDPGVVGAKGITFANSSGYTLYSEINHPFIAEITSADATYNFDQDGIHFQAPSDAAGFIPPTRHRINGGLFRNCWGRSIKAQSHGVSVEGARFERTSGWSNTEALMEIDFQYGGGIAKNLEYHYETHCPEYIVASSAQDALLSNDMIVDGVVGWQNASMTQIILAAVMRTYSSGTPNLSMTSVRNLSHKGRALTNLVKYDVATTTRDTLIVRDTFVPTLVGSMVEFTGGTASIGLNNNVLASGSNTLVNTVSGTANVVSAGSVGYT